MSSYLSMRYKCYRRYFMQIFVNSVERLNSLVYSAPPCIGHANMSAIYYNFKTKILLVSLVVMLTETAEFRPYFHNLVVRPWFHVKIKLF